MTKVLKRVGEPYKLTYWNVRSVIRDFRRATKEGSNDRARSMLSLLEKWYTKDGQHLFTDAASDELQRFFEIFE
jgi:hypothetical protein